MDIILYFSLNDNKYIFYTDKLSLKCGKIVNDKIEVFNDDDSLTIKKIIASLFKEKINFKYLLNNKFKVITDFEFDKLDEKNSVVISFSETKKSLFIDNCDIVKKDSRFIEKKSDDYIEENTLKQYYKNTDEDDSKELSTEEQMSEINQNIKEIQESIKQIQIFTSSLQDEIERAREDFDEEEYTLNNEEVDEVKDSKESIEEQKEVSTEEKISKEAEKNEFKEGTNDDELEEKNNSKEENEQQPDEDKSKETEETTENNTESIEENQNVEEKDESKEDIEKSEDKVANTDVDEKEDTQYKEPVNLYEYTLEEVKEISHNKPEEVVEEKVEETNTEDDFDVLYLNNSTDDVSNEDKDDIEETKELDNTEDLDITKHIVNIDKLDNIEKEVVKESVQKNISKRKLNYKKIFLFLFMLFIIIGLVIFGVSGCIKKNELSKQYSYINKYNINVSSVKVKNDVEANFYDSFVDFYIPNNSFELLRSDSDSINNYTSEFASITITKISNDLSIDDFYNSLQVKDDNVKEVLNDNNINNKYSLIYNWLSNYSNINKEGYAYNLVIDKVLDNNGRYILFNGKKEGYANITDSGVTIVLLGKNNIEINYNGLLSDGDIISLFSSMKYKNN